VTGRSLIRRTLLATLVAGAFAACKPDPQPAAKPAGSETASSNTPTQTPAVKTERARPSLPVLPNRRPDDQRRGPDQADGDGERPNREAMLARRDERRKEVLETYDSDKDGQLSEEERAMMHESRVSGIVDRLDDDGDGRVSPTELSEMRTSARRPLPDFATLDTDKDGFISVEEMAKGRPQRDRGMRGDRGN
jgi:hypothetical protein